MLLERQIYMRTMILLKSLWFPLMHNLCFMESRGGEELPYESAGVLVVSLRGVNFRFWSRLGYSGQNTIIFSRKGLF